AAGAAGAERGRTVSQRPERRADDAPGEPGGTGDPRAPGADGGATGDPRAPGAAGGAEAAPVPDPLVSLRGVSKHFPIKLAWPRRPGVAPHVRLWRAVSRMPATVQAVTEVDLDIRRGE